MKQDKMQLDKMWHDKISQDKMQQDKYNIVSCNQGANVLKNERKLEESEQFCGLFITEISQNLGITVDCSQNESESVKFRRFWCIPMPPGGKGLTLFCCCFDQWLGTRPLESSGAYDSL